MSRYRYIMTAPKLTGLSLAEIDRLDIALGYHFSRYDEDLFINPEIEQEIYHKMTGWGFPVTGKQLDKAFARFKDSYEIYGEHWLRYMKRSWSKFDDLEDWASRHTQCTHFPGSEPGDLYPLDEDLIKQLIDYLQGEPLPVQQTKETDSLLDAIFSKDEIEAYTTDYLSPYNLRVEGAYVLRNILDSIDFDTTYVYLYAND